MKRTIFILLAFFSIFLICSMSIIPSAQSSIVEDEIEIKVNNIINIFDNFKNLIVLWLKSALPITIIWLIFMVGVDLTSFFSVFNDILFWYCFWLYAPVYILYLIFHFDILYWDNIEEELGVGLYHYLTIGFLELVFILRGLKLRGGLI